MVRCEKNNFQFFILCYRNGNFECFLAEKGPGPLGDNIKILSLVLDKHNLLSFIHLSFQTSSFNII